MEAEEKIRNRELVAPVSLFANNALVGMTFSEAVISFGIAGVPQQLIYLSLPVAKSFSKLLNDTLADYEKRTGLTISSLEEIATKEKELLDADKHDADTK